MSENMQQVDEPPHIAAARRQWEMDKRASEEKKIRIVNGRIVTYSPDPPPYDLETTLMMARAEEGRLRRKEIDTALSGNADSSALIGRLIEGRGIFMGTWRPRDRDGNSLGKIFNLFAAPQNLKNDAGLNLTLSFHKAVEHIALIKDLCGYDGGAFKNDTELYNAIKNNRYDGEWFLPTMDILTGTDVDENEVQPDNLFRYKNTGAFAGSLASPNMLALYEAWYWSLTEDRKDPHRALNVRFPDGKYDNNNKVSIQLSVRPVRAELRP